MGICRTQHETILNIRNILRNGTTPEKSDKHKNNINAVELTINKRRWALSLTYGYSEPPKLPHTQGSHRLQSLGFLQKVQNVDTFTDPFPRFYGWGLWLGTVPELISKKMKCTKTISQLGIVCFFYSAAYCVNKTVAPFLRYTMNSM